MKTLVVPLMLAGGVAYAQAPGEVAPTTPAPETQPSMGPAGPGAPAPAPPPTEIDPMKNRISVGVGISSLKLSNDGPEATFRSASIAARYRIARQVDLELELFGGRETIDGEDGPLALGGGFVGGRYRIMPERHWNGYIGLGVGQAIVDAHETTDEMIDNAKRTFVRISGGFEYRWQRFSIGAELALSAHGDREDGGANPSTYDGIVDAQALSGFEMSLRAAFHL